MKMVRMKERLKLKLRQRLRILRIYLDLEIPRLIPLLYHNNTRLRIFLEVLEIVVDLYQWSNQRLRPTLYQMI
jgi:hypothetical protein